MDSPADEMHEICPSPKRIQAEVINSEGPYRLLYCCSKCDKEGVIQELQKGVSPNLAANDKRTPLHLASCEGCTTIVELLLEKGAEVNSTDRFGRTPLADARSFGHGEICKILEARGGTAPVDLGTPCCLIDPEEVNMNEGTLIGEGSFGEVYLVKWRGTEVAAKTIRSSVASNLRVKSIFMKELAMWQWLRHPNIVQYLGVLKDTEPLTFLTEYLRNGSLHDILRKKGRLDAPSAVAYALDIARHVINLGGREVHHTRGMNYLHQLKPHPIIHRDLKPRYLHHGVLCDSSMSRAFNFGFINILLDEAGHLKVADFGLSKIAQEKDMHGSYKMTGGIGSYRYMAPEVYRRESYRKSVDVFSFAFIVQEMFEGRPSNKSESPEAVADKRAYEDSRPSLSSIYPEEIKTLLKECWHKDPERRPSFEDIIARLEIIQENLNEKASAVEVCCKCVIL